MYGTQTKKKTYSDAEGFENDVKMYSTQTFMLTGSAGGGFENDIKMYGTQTWPRSYPVAFYDLR